MERITETQLAPLMNGSAEVNALSTRRLSDSEDQRLEMLLSQMTDRYPHQDLSDSAEGYLWDYQQLALRYSLDEVQVALAEWRITPGATFFPRPDEIASVIVRKREADAVALERHRESQNRVRENGECWAWFDGRIADDGEVKVNGKVCRTDEDFLNASLTLKPRNFGTKPIWA
jgi:hypothetical protein